MKFGCMFFIVILLVSCQKQNLGESGGAISTPSAVSGHDNFDDLAKKKDESCGTEEDAEKKLLEAAKKDAPAAFQGATDGDCTVK